MQKSNWPRGVSVFWSGLSLFVWRQGDQHSLLRSYNGCFGNGLFDDFDEVPDKLNIIIRSLVVPKIHVVLGFATFATLCSTFAIITLPFPLHFFI